MAPVPRSRVPKRSRVKSDLERPGAGMRVPVIKVHKRTCEKEKHRPELCHVRQRQGEACRALGLGSWQLRAVFVDADHRGFMLHADKVNGPRPRRALMGCLTVSPLSGDEGAG